MLKTPVIALRLKLLTISLSFCHQPPPPAHHGCLYAISGYRSILLYPFFSFRQLYHPSTYGGMLFWCLSGFVHVGVWNFSYVHSTCLSNCGHDFRWINLANVDTFWLFVYTKLKSDLWKATKHIWMQVKTVTISENTIDNCKSGTKFDTRLGSLSKYIQFVSMRGRVG